MDNVNTGLNATNQITMLWGNNKQIAFFDKLKKAPYEHYAQIHAKNEKYDDSSWKQNSLIELRVQDQSKISKMKKNINGPNSSKHVVVSFNLEPEILQFILSRINLGIQQYSWSGTKIFGDPDEDGLSFVAKCMIARNQTDNSGKVREKAWFVQVENGRGKRVPNGKKGYYMQGGSYKAEDSAFINLSDLEMFEVLTRVDSYIRAWEITVAQDLIPKGRELDDNAKKAYRMSSEQNSQYYSSSQSAQPSQSVSSGQYAHRSAQFQNDSGGQFNGGNSGNGAFNHTSFTESSYHQPQKSSHEKQSNSPLPDEYQPYIGEQRENIWGM